MGQMGLNELSGKRQSPEGQGGVRQNGFLGDFFFLCFILAGVSTAIQPPISAENQSGSRAQWLVLAAAFLGWMFDGLEMGIFPLVARPALQTMLPSSTALAPDQFVGTWM